MAEPQENPCDNVPGDIVDVKNGIQENTEKQATAEQQNHPVEPPQPALCQVAPDAAGDNPIVEKDANANTKETETNNNNSNTVLQLQEEISKRTQECDDLRKKLAEAERKLSRHEQPSAASPDSSQNQSGPGKELAELRAALDQAKLALEERERRIASQDHQIAALSDQVTSLKEVVLITKEMLNVRNMEVKHLQEDVDKMEMKISAERDRQSDVLGKMDAAVKLNADLKKEYQTQLQLFQDLRGKYEEKVSLLSEENKALETAMQAQPAQ